MTSRLTPKKRGMLQMMLLILCGIALYASTLNGPFLFDDYVVIVNEPSIHDFALSWSDSRLVTNLTYAINYRLHGLETTGYHLVNLLVHLVNGLLVYALLNLLLQTPRLLTTAIASRRQSLAFLAALLFIIHPVQTQAVSYIAQRYASLAALFYLAAICLYLLFRQAERTTWQRAFAYAGFLLSLLLAIKSKENAVTLPAAIVLVEFIFFSTSLKKRLIYLSPFVAGFVLVTGYLLAGGVSIESLDAMTRLDTAMSRGDYLLTQLRVIATYLRLLILPVGQNLDYDYPLYTSLDNPEVLAALLLHISILGSGIYALTRGNNCPQLLLAGFGIAWFYLTLSVESSIIPIVDVIYEHRLYLPSIGIFMIFAGFTYSWKGLAENRRNALVLTLILAVVLGATTLNRNQVWQSSFALWQDTARKSPNKARPLNNLGVMYYRQGEKEKALEYYLKAINADRRYLKAYFNAGEAYQDLGNLQQALIYYRIFVSAWPDYPETHRKLAEIYRQLGQEELVEHHSKLLERYESKPLKTLYR